LEEAQMLGEQDHKTLENGAVAIPTDVAAHAHVDPAQYREMYAASVADPEAFWAEQGRRLDWITPYGRAKNTSFAWPDISIR
jgi:acetyl-CoA synthetase